MCWKAFLSCLYPQDKDESTPVTPTPNKVALDDSPPVIKVQEVVETYNQQLATNTDLNPIAIEQQQNKVLKVMCGIKHAGVHYVSSLAGYEHPDSNIEPEKSQLAHSTYKESNLGLAGNFAERRHLMEHSGIQNMSPFLGSRGPDSLTRIQPMVDYSWHRPIGKLRDSPYKAISNQ